MGRPLLFPKGEIRQFALKKSAPALRMGDLVQQKDVELAQWPDGTPKSLANDFNWRNGEPSSFNKGK